MTRSGRAELARLRDGLSQYDRSVGRASIESQVKAKAAGLRRVREAAGRLLAPAVLAEVAGLTPAHVRLTGIRLEQGPPRGAARGKGARPGSSGMAVTLDGAVAGEPEAQNSLLAEYVLRIEDSPLFEQAELRGTSTGSEQDGRLLSFVLVMTVRETALPEEREE
jgi:hypothetical protein